MLIDADIDEDKHRAQGTASRTPEASSVPCFLRCCAIDRSPPRTSASLTEAGVDYT
jgi:hypothetical protein